jgi:hypothetical protein
MCRAIAPAHTALVQMFIIKPLLLFLMNVE